MIRVDPDKFAQSVVASHPNLGIPQQLKEYVAAYKMADDYNLETNKLNKPKPEKQDYKRKTQQLRDVGLI